MGAFRFPSCEVAANRSHSESGSRLGRFLTHSDLQQLLACEQPSAVPHRV